MATRYCTEVLQNVTEDYVIEYVNLFMLFQDITLYLTEFDCAQTVCDSDILIFPGLRVQQVTSSVKKALYI